ncbi:MAG: hypothetical protein V8T10_00145 [Merdibacter sp.]
MHVLHVSDIHDLSQHEPPARRRTTRSGSSSLHRHPFAIAGADTLVRPSLIQGRSGIVILIIEWSMALAGVLLKAIAKAIPSFRW